MIIEQIRLLEAHLIAGAKLSFEDVESKWLLSQKNGEGIVSGGTLFTLIMNLFVGEKQNETK